MVSTTHRATGFDITHDITAQLVAVSGGDMSAFADLYESLAPRVYGLTVRILQDEHASEEVTQEVFIEVWQSSSRFRPDRGSGPSWVMTIAHRRAVDRVRSTEAWRRRNETDHLERSRNTAVDETAAAAHASLDAQMVRGALARLPLSQRQAIELAYLGGHTYKEVSGLLQVPLGTTKTRIRAGLSRLRATMAAVPGETG